MQRRHALRVLGSPGLAASMAGCIGFLTGSEPLTLEAEQATLSGRALEETGYEEDEIRDEVIERSFSAAGQEREVEVTNWVATYDRTLELGPLGEQELGVFAVLSTPQVKILDRTFNPVGEMSNRELLQELQGRYSSFSVGNRVDTTEMSVLGEAAEIEKYEGTASFEQTDIELFIHITNVPHESDFVIPVAVYPKRLPGESERVFRLYRGIQH